jgi:hypothetical protein
MKIYVHKYSDGTLGFSDSYEHGAVEMTIAPSDYPKYQQIWDSWMEMQSALADGFVAGGGNFDDC